MDISEYPVRIYLAQLYPPQPLVSTFSSHYLAVKNMQTTGDLSEEIIISGAIARYCSLDIYEAIRKDQEQDKRKGKAEKRKGKLAHC